MNVPRLASVLVAGTLCLAGFAHAKPWWMRGAQSKENDFLPPDQAFQVSARIDGNQIRIRWVIADGYYLYRQRMAVAAESPDLAISAPEWPPGKLKTDPYLGTQEIYTQQVEATAAYTRSDGGAHPLEIRVTYQGCATAGLCYPPLSKVMFPGPALGTPAAAAAAAVALPVPPRSQATPVTPSGLQAEAVASQAHSAAHADAPSHPWQRYAILGGFLAFLLAGVLLQKSRHLPLPHDALP